MSKVKISVEQLQQLIAWAGTEPDTEVTIERTDGEEGPGLYAFNSDHPEEGAIRLDDGVHSAPEGNSVTLPWSPPMLDGPRPPIAGACVAPGRLRATVKHSFESAHDPEDAALRICVAIDAELGLSGNGWFDDDPAVLAAGGTPLRATAGAIDADEISHHLQVKDEPDSPPAPPLRSVSIDGVCVKCVGADAERAEREAAARQLMEMMFPDDESDELDSIPTPASGTLH
ncbi:hypothetical protein NTC87_11930 [Stenotrophomonas geniculata]|nr:hypothetical protein [Stenotrophomonas geniculata]